MATLTPARSIDRPWPESPYTTSRSRCCRDKKRRPRFECSISETQPARFSFRMSHSLASYLNFIHNLLDVGDVLSELFSSLALARGFHRALQGQNTILGVVADVLLIEPLGDKTCFVVVLDTVVQI